MSSQVTVGELRRSTPGLSQAALRQAVSDFTLFKMPDDMPVAAGVCLLVWTAAAAEAAELLPWPELCLALHEFNDDVVRYGDWLKEQVDRIVSDEDSMRNLNSFHFGVADARYAYLTGRGDKLDTVTGELSPMLLPFELEMNTLNLTTLWLHRRLQVEKWSRRHKAAEVDDERSLLACLSAVLRAGSSSAAGKAADR